MKRLEHSLEGYLHAVFNDIHASYRSDHEWTRDLNRSLHELAIRGERFLTIDLPAVRKHLDRCLDDEIYTVSGLFLCSKKSPAIVVPAFLADLYLQIFHHDGKLRCDANPYVVADLRQLLDGLGKLKHPCKEKYIDDEIKTFLANDAGLRSPSLDWESDELTPSGANLPESVRPSFADSICGSGGRDDLFGVQGPIEHSIPNVKLRTLQRVCDILASSLGDFSNEASLTPKHGTGRVSNLRKDQSKFDFSCWPNKLDRIFPFDLYGSYCYGIDRKDDYGLRYSNHEHPSKLIAVPKTMSGPRLIGSEPNYHLFIQQLIRLQIERSVKQNPYFVNCITFGDQQPNRDLACSSSVDGSYATVDLKSASDLLSCWTVERALRANYTLLERIHSSRTRTMSYSFRNNSGVLKLKKCFTQGSACTFPVQTLVYSMISIAAVLISTDAKPTPRNIAQASKLVRIFGDDIIVPTSSLRTLEAILSHLQLKVNRAKTFSGHQFRESCGFDAFRGYDVTPTRIRRFASRPSNEVRQSMIESANNLLLRGYWNLSSWIDSITGINLPIDLPHKYGCAYSFSGQRLDHLPSRYNHKLHRIEYRCEYLVSKASLRLNHNANDMFQFLLKQTASDPLDFLWGSNKSSLGIVEKASSVMKRGWINWF